MRLCDLHADTFWKIDRTQKKLGEDSPDLQTSIPRLKAGGVGLQVMACFVEEKYVPFKACSKALELLDMAHSEFDENQNDIEIVRAPWDAERISASGKLAALLAIEGGHALEGDLTKLRTFFRLGVRILTLTWNNSNDLAFSCKDPDGERHGLLPPGVDAVEKMNELGMMIDLSHSGPVTFQEVLERSTYPVFASHSCARALCDNNRNLTDQQLQALADKGGVVGVSFANNFLSLPESEVTSETVVDHIAHIRKVAGIEVIAFGSDFDGVDDLPQGLQSAADWPNLLSALKRRGFTEEEIVKFSAGNFLRFWKSVCRDAPPITS